MNCSSICSIEFHSIFLLKRVANPDRGVTRRLRKFLCVEKTLQLGLHKAAVLLGDNRMLYAQSLNTQNHLIVLKAPTERGSDSIPLTRNSVYGYMGIKQQKGSLKLEDGWAEWLRARY